LQRSKDMRAMFDEDLERYKLITRSVTEAERMWRFAVLEFRRARRRRERLL
jgi:hypothetical protein